MSKSGTEPESNIFAELGLTAEQTVTLRKKRRKKTRKKREQVEGRESAEKSA